MAYLKKAYRILMERIDKELKMPQGWYFFVKKQNMISVLYAIILI